MSAQNENERVTPSGSEKSLNKLVSEGKRFMAYGIVKKLKQKGKKSLLQELEKGVQENEKKKGKKHQVFRLSFDAKMCYNENVLEQKLEYIHCNPVSGKWNLVSDYVDYEHSSAGFYELNKSRIMGITHYKSIGEKNEV